jgi:AraC-like DNA-binding protein
MKNSVEEGFPRERLVVVPAEVQARCRALPIVELLYVTDIGMYPTAPLHYVKRNPGIAEAILICCLSGEGSLEIAGVEHKVQRGHVVFVPPECPHIYQADTTSPWSIFWFHFGGTQTKAALNSLGVTCDRPLVSVADPAPLRMVFEDAYACLSYHYSDAGLMAMTIELMRILGKIRVHQSHTDPHLSDAGDRINKTIQFMHEHIDLRFKLSDFAAHTGQSVSYFSKLFRQRTGVSPMDYFTQMKIRKACELLDTTDLPVLAISKQLGYEDAYFFSRKFKSVQGCSPLRYRNRERG